uniref:SGF29 C-terminal domain-containing protein n=1 Tax=Globodera pallida TaxID=36090 RepID=A0A183CPH5_GLOPA
MFAPHKFGEIAEQSVEQHLRIAEILKRQFQLSLEALSCLTVRKTFSETIRMKFHDEKSGATIGSQGLSELLQLIDDYADTLPLYVAPLNLQKGEKLDGRAAKRPLSALYPPLVGSTPLPDSDAIPIGMLVAAWKKEKNVRESKWILAEILDFRDRDGNGRGHYTLLDHVAEHEFFRNYFGRCQTPPIAPSGKYSPADNLPFLLSNISRRDIIPLPCFRADPRHNANALFGPGSIVMARFPKTSVFYRSCVLAPPENLRDGYRVTFDLDAEFDLDGYSRDGAMQCYTIPQLYVVQNPPGLRRSPCHTNKRKADE